MNKLFIAVFTFFLCSASFAWAPMDGTTRTLNPYGQQYYDIATETQKPYMQPFICYVSFYNPGRKLTMSYSTYDLDLRSGTFEAGENHLFYIDKDHQTFMMEAFKGFITPGKNTGTLIFKYLDGPGVAKVTCVQQPD